MDPVLVPHGGEVGRGPLVARGGQRRVEITAGHRALTRATKSSAIEPLDDQAPERAQPLALVVPDLSGIARFAVVQDFHYRFIKHLVPGPYVFILEATREVPKLLMMKRKTIGIRVPDHPIPLALARELGAPIISTTASHPAEGDEAIQDPDVIDDRFPHLAMVLDGGFGDVHPSTVIDLTKAEPTLIRAGAGMDKLDGLFGMRQPLSLIHISEPTRPY